MAWTDIRSHIEWLGSSKLHFVHSHRREDLIKSLHDLGYAVYFIDGSRVRDEIDFFDQCACALDFPNYCGKNWDAFYDCIGDFEPPNARRFAIIWDNVVETAESNLPCFARVCHELSSLSMAFRNDPGDLGEPEQFEAFYLGTGKGFIGQ